MRRFPPVFQPAARHNQTDPLPKGAALALDFLAVCRFGLPRPAVNLCPRKARERELTGTLRAGLGCC